MSWHSAVMFFQKGLEKDDGRFSTDISEEDQLWTFVLDHIVQNCNTQDLWATVMIME